MTPEQQFFFDQAGWSYDPATQSPFVGQVLGAIKLAAAEAWAHDADALFQWDVDDIDSTDFAPEEPAHELYSCLMYMTCDECPEPNTGLATERAIDQCPRKNWTHVKGSLGGIDFGANKGPWGAPYKRVVEAELALEAMLK